MVHHVAFGSETKPAFLRASERTCVKVNEHVGLQILFFREGLVAVRHWTLEGLSAKVHVHVSPVSVKSSERFLTLITSIFAN